MSSVATPPLAIHVLALLQASEKSRPRGELPRGFAKKLQNELHSLESCERQMTAEAALSGNLARTFAYMTLVGRISGLLLELPMYSKFAQRIGAANREWMPGEPPMSPVHDSAYVAWYCLDLRLGEHGERLLDSVVALFRQASLNDIANDMQRLGESRYGVYNITSTPIAEMSVVEEVFTGKSIYVLHHRTMNSRTGATYLWRLLPSPGTAQEKVGMASPYSIIDFSRAKWESYVQRMAPSAASLALAYEDVMRADGQDTRWIDYVIDGYAGNDGGKIAIEGIPDEPDTLPHSLSRTNEMAFGAIADGMADDETIRYMLRELQRIASHDAKAAEGLMQAVEKLTGQPTSTNASSVRKNMKFKPRRLQ